MSSDILARNEHQRNNAPQDGINSASEHNARLASDQASMFYRIAGITGCKSAGKTRRATNGHLGILVGCSPLK